MSNKSDNNDDFDVVEYRKLLKNMFPSKYINEKVKADKKLNKLNLNDITNKVSSSNKSSVS